MKKVYIKIIAAVLLIVGCLSVTGCNGGDNGAATPTPSVAADANAKPVEVKIESAVSEEVKSKIDFDAYKEQRAYVLGESDTSSDIKLLCPISAYMTDKIEVIYHVALNKADDGSDILEIFGTDFSFPKGVKEIKVEWKKYSQYNNNMYRLENLCITIDGEVYFYEEEFFTPRIAGREIVVNNK